MEISGSLTKMRVHLDQDEMAQYHLNLGGEDFSVNAVVGSKVQIRFLNRISCMHCGRATKKSFANGYCYPCFRSLAQCDLCVMKPETCHFDRGTCREPDWGQAHCMIPHSVYISNSSGPKIGITRFHQKLRRWIDQGAIQAIEFCTTRTRKDAGLIEVAIAKHIPDKTNWRKMLMQEPPSLQLAELRQSLQEHLPSEVEYQISRDEMQEISFPIIARPAKLSSLSIEALDSVVESKLIGIKAQYLIFEVGVMNLAKFQGYHVALTIDRSEQDRTVVGLQPTPFIAPPGPSL